MGIGLPVENNHLVVENGAILTSLGPDYYVYSGTGGDIARQHNPSDGTTNWTVNFGNSVFASDVGINANWVYIGDTSGNLKKIAPGDGSVSWTNTSSNQVRSISAGMDGNYLYIGDYDGSVRQIGVDNTNGWTSSFSDTIHCEAGVNGNYIYVVNYDYITDAVYKLDISDGSTVNTRSDVQARREAIAVGVNGNYIYIDEGELQQISTSDLSDGWTFATGPVNNGIGTGLDGNYVYMVDTSSNLHKINVSDGSEVTSDNWPVSVGIATSHGLGVSPDGTYIYVAIDDNNAIVQVDANDGSIGWTYTGYSNIPYTVTAG